MMGSHTLLLLLPTSLPSESSTQITNPFLFFSAERRSFALCTDVAAYLPEAKAVKQRPITQDFAVIIPLHKVQIFPSNSSSEH